jgi:hypothetical protein
MKVQIMERKTWEKVSRATEMENSMTHILNRYLVMGDFTVGTIFTQPFASTSLSWFVGRNVDKLPCMNYVSYFSYHNLS